MGFRDILKQDLERTFFNQQEFGEKHMWGNREITALVDDDDLIAKYSSEFEFLSRGSHLVLIPKSQFSSKPRTGSTIIFDGHQYTLNEVKEMSGMYHVFLDSIGG